MRAQKDGLVINISSWAGRFDPLSDRRPPITHRKHGVVAMTLLAEYGGMRQRHPRLRDLSGRGGDADPEEAADAAERAEMARMLQAEDLGRTIRFVAEMPPHVCSMRL